MQTATRAAAQGGGELIRKMRPFEEPRALLSGRWASIALGKGHGGLFSKAALNELYWNVNEALDFTIGQPLKGLCVVASDVDI